MSVMMVQADVKPEHVEEVEAAVRTMFTAIERAQPHGVRYASTRTESGKGDTFVILLQVDDDLADANPLAAVPEFRDFQAALGRWLAEPPTPAHLHVVGSYNLF